MSKYRGSYLLFPKPSFSIRISESLEELLLVLRVGEIALETYSFERPIN